MTEQTKTGVALKASEGRLRRLVDANVIGITFGMNAVRSRTRTKRFSACSGSRETSSCRVRSRGGI